jgi:glutamine amidotransferase
MGNLRSVEKAIELYTDKVQISKDPASIKKSSGIIMPGDGAFGTAMDNLKAEGWIEPLKEYINADKPFMGICLGYQLLFSESEEFGNYKGLDVIQGKIVKFKTDDLKVPHMGWNNVELNGESQYLNNIEQNSYFYFIHTYYSEVADQSWVRGETEYGVKFACIVGKGNIIATQFHPEKSHKVGLKIIENFAGKTCS